MPVVFIEVEYRLTCSFKSYCSLFLGTTTLTPMPVVIRLTVLHRNDKIPGPF